MPLSDMGALVPQPLARGIGITDRPGQVVQQAFSGDLPAVWRAAFQPKELTPLERDRLLRKWGLDQGPYAQVFKTLTNPLLIAMLALSHKFPIPAGNNIFKMSKAVEGFAAKFPVLRKLASMQGLFLGMKRRGSKVDFVDEFGAIIKDTADFRSKYGGLYAENLSVFEGQTGRLPSLKEQRLVGAWLDGLHKPLRGYQGKNGKIRIGSGETTASLEAIGTLMPNLEANMGGPLLRLARGFRQTLDDQWREVFSDVKGRKRILEAIRRQKSSGLSDGTLDTMSDFLRDPKKVSDYFPRRIVQSEEDFRKLIAVLTESASTKKFAKSATRRAQQWASPEVYKRKFQMLPAFEDLDQMGDVVDAGARARLDALSKARLIHAARIEGVRGSTLRMMDKTPLRELEAKYPAMFQPAEAQKIASILADVRPREYSLKLMPVISQYNHTLAGTNAWTVKGGGEKVVQMLDELKFKSKANSVARYQAHILEDTYIPVAMGRGTFRSTLRANLWSQSTQMLALKLENSSGLQKVLGESLTKSLTEGMKSSRGAFSLANLERKTAGYFYLSTLGLNPGSALKNMLQLVLTTGPVIGYRTAAAGAGEAMRKAHKYYALRYGSSKLNHQAAIRKAYPEFGKSGLSGSPLTEEALENTLINAYEIGKLPGVKGAKATIERVSRSMMAVFSTSEHAVRLATFEAGMIHARRAKMPIDAAIELSRKLVERTQFLTGPQNTPFFLLDKSPLVRQLTQFPLRMLEFVTTTAMTLGSGAIDPRTGKAMNWLGLNPGTFARMIAGSVIAMELGEAMNWNVGDALIGGALPTFQPAGKVLAPIPIVPPFFQILGATAMGLGSGDFSELARSTPLLIPGGTQLFRMMGLVPNVPGDAGRVVSKAFDRTYADYSQPAPDGRIALFSGKGTLKGYYRPWEIIRYGMGIKGGDIESESLLLQMMVKQRDQIREARRSYMDARFRNNASEANQITENFIERFGFNLPVTEKDMKAMQLRRQMTRLEQVVRTMPPGPAREQVIQIIAQTLGTQGQQILGVDPALLGEPSAVRQAARTANVGRPGFNAKTGLSPLDFVNPTTIGRQRGVNQQQPPF
ncbi:hypothetical protein LCGC14_0455360 [marine sediment metagenome]|uniref:Large polyvalent protein associated domain-containing protein n=1 Tax=marine sediment metagenome TaxID=412755 RepID=A0A0F9SZT3_9ZZZZ